MNFYKGTRLPMLLPDNYTPTSQDVICGRGRQFCDHIGNKRFKLIVEQNVQKYMDAKTKNDKSDVVMNIVSLVRNGKGTTNGDNDDGDCGGCFIDRDNSTDRLYEIGDTLAREKVGHALRHTMKQLMNKSSSEETKPTITKVAEEEEEAIVGASNKNTSRTARGRVKQVKLISVIEEAMSVTNEEKEEDADTETSDDDESDDESDDEDEFFEKEASTSKVVNNNNDNNTKKKQQLNKIASIMEAASGLVTLGSNNRTSTSSPSATTSMKRSSNVHQNNVIGVVPPLPPPPLVGNKMINENQTPIKNVNEMLRTFEHSMRNSKVSQSQLRGWDKNVMKLKNNRSHRNIIQSRKSLLSSLRSSKSKWKIELQRTGKSMMMRNMQMKQQMHQKMQMMQMKQQQMQKQQIQMKRQQMQKQQQMHHQPQQVSLQQSLLPSMNINTTNIIKQRFQPQPRHHGVVVSSIASQGQRRLLLNRNTNAVVPPPSQQHVQQGQQKRKEISSFSTTTTPTTVALQNQQEMMQRLIKRARTSATTLSSNDAVPVVTAEVTSSSHDIIDLSNEGQGQEKQDTQEQSTNNKETNNEIDRLNKEKKVLMAALLDSKVKCQQEQKQRIALEQEQKKRMLLQQRAALVSALSKTDAALLNESNGGGGTGVSVQQQQQRPVPVQQQQQRITLPTMPPTAPMQPPSTLAGNSMMNHPLLVSAKANGGKQLMMSRLPRGVAVPSQMYPATTTTNNLNLAHVLLVTQPTRRQQGQTLG